MITHVGPAVRRVTAALTVTLLAVTLAACNLIGSGYQLDQERVQARAALQRWDDAAAAAGDQGLVVVGDQTGQIGDWEEPVGENNKEALIAGKVEASVTLPDSPPPPADVRWDDGSSQTLPVISAAQALKDVQASGAQACPDCNPLEVTAATLTTVKIDTNHGPARAPAWDFSLNGTAVHLTRVAVAAGAKITVTPPPWDPNNAPVGLSIESASGSPGSRALTVTFTGAPGPGSEPCGADYSGEAVESSTAIVVIVIEASNPVPVACTAVGAMRTATVQLVSPLGNRAVLEVRQGLPVPVTLAP